MKAKLLILNTTAKTGSTGRIAEEIGLQAQQSANEVRFAYGRKAYNSRLPLIKIGGAKDILWHGIKSIILDQHGFASKNATIKFTKELEVWKPELINIHNLHGYYLNIEILFNYIKDSEIPVVWTFHDCWPFTGHCSYFDRYNCKKWETECFKCPNRKGYPSSWLIDNSRENYRRKRELFNGIKNLTIVTPSEWMASNVSRSFLKGYPVQVINNGIDLESFNPLKSGNSLSRYGLRRDPLILGVASIWDSRKGLDDFIKLRGMLNPKVQIVLVGLTKNQSKNLPEGITAIERTESIAELASLYSAADVFVNPTYVDNFPTTNLEALACGTPVITYNTGGSPEAIDTQTGIVVEKGNIDQLKSAVELILSKGKNNYSLNCRQRAELLYNKSDRYKDYIDLFNKMLT